MFISYFREGSTYHAKWLEGVLKQRSKGHVQVFRDRSSIKYGRKWSKKLKEAVCNCDVFLLVITPEWQKETVFDKLSDQKNWVRKEIIEASKRGSTCRMIPVLMEINALPKLPDDIQRAVSACQYKVYDDSIDPNGATIDALIESITEMSILELDHQIKSRPVDDKTVFFANLDRIAESGHVDMAQKEDETILAVNYCQEDGMVEFATRCFKQLGGAYQTGQDSAIWLQWNEFARPEHKEIRQKNLHDAISAQLGLEKKARGEAIKKYLEGCDQPLVFYAKASHSGKTLVARYQEWREQWLDLLPSNPSTRVVVLLFVCKCPPVLAPDHTGAARLVNPGLSMLDYDTTKEFVDSYGYLATNSQALEEQADKLFSKSWFTRKRPKKRYKTVRDKLEPLFYLQ